MHKIDQSNHRTAPKTESTKAEISALVLSR